MDVKAKRKLNQNHDESDVDVIKKKSNKNDDEGIKEMENEEVKEEINILNEYSNVNYCEEDCSDKDKEIGDSNQTVAKIKCMEKDKRVDTCVKVTNKFVNEDQKNNKLEIHVQDLSDASPLLVQVSFPSKNISKVEEWRKILSRGNTICIMNGIKKEKKKNKTIITHLEIDEKSTIAKMSSQMKFENSQTTLGTLLVTNNFPNPRKWSESVEKFEMFQKRHNVARLYFAKKKVSQPPDLG